jgi:hypothetical protein
VSAGEAALTAAAVAAAEQRRKDTRKRLPVPKQHCNTVGEYCVSSEGYYHLESSLSAIGDRRGGSEQQTMSSHAAATAAAQGNLSTDPETLACGERVFNTHGGGAVAGGAAFSVLTRLRAIQLMEVQGKAPAVLDPSLFRSPTTFSRNIAALVCIFLSIWITSRNLGT